MKLNKKTKQAIANAILNLGIEEKNIYCVRELDAIASAANATMIDVMAYLRFYR